MYPPELFQRIVTYQASRLMETEIRAEQNAIAAKANAEMLQKQNAELKELEGQVETQRQKIGEMTQELLEKSNQLATAEEELGVLRGRLAALGSPNTQAAASAGSDDGVLIDMEPSSQIIER